MARGGEGLGSQMGALAWLAWLAQVRPGKAQHMQQGQVEAAWVGEVARDLGVGCVSGAEFMA